MKKVLFGITSLNLGGAERVLIDLCNRLCYSYDIEILTIYPNGSFEKELNKKVKVKSIMDNDLKHISKIQKKILSLKLLFPLTRKSIYRKYVSNSYDKVIAFLEGGITTLFSCDENIAWIHNDIQKVFGKSLSSKIKKLFNKNIYKKYKKIIFVSNHNLEKFNEVYDIDAEKEVVFNYLDRDLVIKKSMEKINFKLDKNNINFLTVARLVEQKGIDRLIKIHTKLINNGYKHNYYVVGEGPKHQELEKLIKENNVSDTFHLLGAKKNPYPYIKMCDVFCLLSYYEGLGVVLLEAIALNKNIFITDTASREALTDYNKKVISDNNEKSIYESFVKIITDKNIFNKDTVKGVNVNEDSIKKIKKFLEE